VVDVWLRADADLKGSVIHERLVAEHGFTGSYQRVKMYVVSRPPAAPLTAPAAPLPPPPRS